jgi:hypothetical protein
MGLGGLVTGAHTFGDAWAHEYGHIVSDAIAKRIGKDRWMTFLADFRGDNLLKLSKYADTSDEEFWGEAFMAMTRPDYVAGTLARDTEAWALMRDAGIWKAPTRELPEVTFGPFPTEQVLVDPDNLGLAKGWKWGVPDSLGRGTTERQLLRDPSGQEFLLKGESTAQEVAGSRVTTLFGLSAPPVERIKFGDDWYAWQAIVPHTAQSYKIRAPDTAALERVLTRPEEQQLLGHGPRGLPDQ